jgi:NAD(P)H dehydrogenase (quinone)
MENEMATKIQVVFYSMYGHIHTMAEAIVAGAREVADTRCGIMGRPDV